MKKPIIDGFSEFDYFEQGSAFVAWHARQDALDRRVLLQIMKPEMAKSIYHREHFFELARMLSRLKCMYLPEVLDIVNQPEYAYIIFEGVQGETLASALTRERKFTPQKALHIAFGLATALEDLWTQTRVVVRNLKPGVILLGTDGHARIWDLTMGVVADESFSLSAHTQGHVEGLPGYISPEQITLADHFDTRSDMYSLGAVLYRTVMGVDAYAGGSFESIVERQITKDVPPIRRFEPTLPQALEDLISRLMQRAPEDRFDDWHEVIAAISAILAEFNAVHAKPVPRPQLPPSPKKAVAPKKPVVAKQPSRPLGAALPPPRKKQLVPFSLQMVMWGILGCALAYLALWRWQHTYAPMSELVRGGGSSSVASFAEQPMKSGNSANELPANLESNDSLTPSQQDVPQTVSVPPQNLNGFTAESLAELIAAMRSEQPFEEMTRVLGQEGVAAPKNLIRCGPGLQSYNRLFERGLSEKIGQNISLEYKGRTRHLVLKDVAGGKLQLDHNGLIGTISSDNEGITDAERLNWAAKPRTLGEAVSYVTLCARAGKISQASSLGRQYPDLAPLIKKLAE